MNSILLYDPLIMGHHLVYAENFTDWALSRGMRVYFCGYHFHDSFYHRRFSDQPDVKFLELDDRLFAHRACFQEMVKEMGATAFYYDRIRPLLFDDDGPAIQTQFIKTLQKQLNPEFTLILYGDEMWSQWETMESCGDRFESPTYLWLLYAGGYSYDPTGLHTRDIRPFLFKQKIFRAVATCDEYQAARFDPQGQILRYVPDPYRRFAGVKDEILSEEEIRQFENLSRFLEGGDGPVLLIPGLMEARKNAHWLLEAVAASNGLSLAILGRKNLPATTENQAQTIFKGLEAQGRLFTVFSYVPDRLLKEAMTNPRVHMLPLPYRRHDLSSGIQLMALACGLPCLVPDNGLMARRTLEHGLGRVFHHEVEADFKKNFPIILDCERSAYAKACASFTAHINQETFYSGADRLFGLAPDQNPDPLVLDAARRDEALLNRNTHAADCSAWLFHKALLYRDLNRLDESLNYFKKAGVYSNGATRPDYIRAMVLEETGRLSDAYGLLNGLLKKCPDHPDVAAWIDLKTDTVVKYTPLSESRIKILTTLREQCGEGPLFGALIEVLSDRVWYHIDRGRHDLAEQILYDISRVVPEHIRTHFILAMNRMRAGETELAEAAFQDLEAFLSRRLGRTPDDAECLRCRAEVWAQLGRYEEAAQAFTELAESHNDLASMLHLSDALRKAGHFNESMAALEQGFVLGACTEGVLAEKAARIEAERAAAE